MSRTVVRAIEQRRKADNAYRNMDQAIQAEKRYNHIANFEINTTKKIEQRMKQERYNKIRAEQELSLLERRRALADLYNDEMEGWTNEVMSNVETIEDQKKRIMERAYALRDARERERQLLVQEKLDKQWRDGLDEARTSDSHANNIKCKQTVLDQISEKIRRKQELTDEEDLKVVEWKKIWDNQERVEIEKEERRKEADRKLVEGLRAQIFELQERKRLNRSLTKMEDEEELRRIRAALEHEESEQRRRAEEGRQRGQQILSFNANHKQEMEEEKRLRRAQDNALLQYALMKERKALNAEEAKREQNKRHAAEYRNYLEEQMIKDAEDSALVDQMRRMEEEKAWKLRDDTLQAREDARKYLMQTVDQGRQEQIQNKRQQNLSEKQLEAQRATKFIEDAREGMEQERLAAARRRMVAMENTSKLSEQIKLREEREAKEKQESYLEYKLAQHAERLQKQKLDALYRR